jgi:hypothetical protein
MRPVLLVLLLAPQDDAVRELSDFGVAGMNRRLGPAGEAPKEAPPLLWQPPEKPCPPARHNQGMTYGVGGPPTASAGDFSSTQAQVLYAGGGPGIDRVLIHDMQNNCLSQKPEPPWWGGFRPEPAVLEWRKKGAAPAGPIAIARGLASWSNHALILHGNGWVTTAGTATSQGTHPVLKLPAGKLPTALAVTPNNELGLVTVIDVKEKKGQLAVIALEAHAPGFAHDWHQRFPMMPNQASFSDLKLLGFVDLPIRAPTAVSGSTSRTGGRLNGPDGNIATPASLNLEDAGVRASFGNGGNGGFVAKAGYAVVVSKSEDQAVFVDLQPLLGGVREAYFGDPAAFAKTRDLGPKPEQWPPTFEKRPGWTPVVVGSAEVPRPSSVLARPGGGEHARVFVGCEAGEVRSFAVGGLATEAPADPAQIRPAGTLAVGRNPTWLAHKGGGGGPDFGFIVVSRGERALQWVRFGPSAGKIERELRDRRLVDPVHCEIADTHGIEMELVTVADFKGRKIVNYRCSPVVFATNGGARYGCGPKGQDPFECGGVLPLPGCPFAVCGTNVN